MTSCEFIPKAELEALLQRYEVAGVSIAVIQPGESGDGAKGSQIRTQACGLACRETKTPLFDSTWLELASLSKTLAAAFMIQYFEDRGMDLDCKVHPLLKASGSTFRLKAAAGKPSEWTELVTLRQLCDHTGLGMHYVNGVPLRKPMPPVQELISGSAAKPAPYGYAPLDIEKEPGTKFGYSGGGFLVLQHLLETMEKKPIDAIMQPFLAGCGAMVSHGMSFAQDVPGKHYAVGYKEGKQGPVEDTRLMFPPLAAGSLGTPTALADWLRQLALAYKRPEGCGNIRHSTARAMLTPGPDLGSEAFMRALMGIGVFVFEAASPGLTPSKWMLHQAANDGFRGLFLVCFDGPDAANGPRGFVVLSNGDNNGMFLNCAVVRKLLQSAQAFDPPLQGLDWSRVKSMDGFSITGLKQAEIVNLGIKDLVLQAFCKPEGPPAKKARM
eukprot:TRINITY_DN49909_c0_g1_i1.p1 TRINITY_DN49909_c0_g1~~TRINITY_DN49909_c0_g1_i1.p1  ORF type:complete len:454 (-),score=116.75 TRINITY_DN49909_c0_g1_i1:151-1470(-)